jgi:hypothetical protein
MVRGGDVDDVGGVEILRPEVESRLVGEAEFSQTERGAQNPSIYLMVVCSSIRS